MGRHGTWERLLLIVRRIWNWATGRTGYEMEDQTVQTYQVPSSSRTLPFAAEKTSKTSQARTAETLTRISGSSLEALEESQEPEQKRPKEPEILQEKAAGENPALLGLTSALENERITRRMGYRGR